jgi:ABC-2 type transport system permease protein
MNTQSDELPDSPAPEVLSPTRPLYWSIRRELWENRSIYMAPVMVASIFLFGFLISCIGLNRRMRGLPGLDALKQHQMVVRPYDTAAFMILLTTFLIGIFYCFDALQSERRDRSILFWKSLPVSDRTTVLSKASIPLVVLPLLALTITVALQMVMMMVSTLVLLGNSPGLLALWTHVKFVQTTLAMIYGLIVIALWHAPLYGWLLLVSAWAKRTVLLWVVLPPLVISIFETLVFHTTYFGLLLKYRLIGFFKEAFDASTLGHPSINPLTTLTPGSYLLTPGLWLGLLFAVAFLAAAIRLRRYREPM